MADYAITSKKTKTSQPNFTSITLNNINMRYDGNIASSSRAGIAVDGEFTANHVYNATYNDLADAIEVPENTNLKPGYCYNLSGGECNLTKEYMEKGVLGIHSDTYGFKMGIKKQKCIDLAVAGFVLAYVDKEYPSGTPLTCTSGGRLTEMQLQDKKDFPERLVGIFWKKESNKEWGPENNKIRVDGRCWVKII